jgi:hypothetical protein
MANNVLLYVHFSHLPQIKNFFFFTFQAASPLMEMLPSERCPSLQYMDDVDPGGVADMAGIRQMTLPQSGLFFPRKDDKIFFFFYI